MTTSAMMSPTSKHGVVRVKPARGATGEAVPSLNSGFSLSPQMVGAAALVGVMMKCMDSRNGDQELSKPHQNAKYDNSQDWEEIPCLSQDDDLDNDDSMSQSSSCSSSARSPPAPLSTTKTTKTSHPSPPKTIHKSLAAPSTAIDGSDSSKIEITSLSSSPALKLPRKATTRTSSIKTVRATPIAKIKRASVKSTTSVGTATTVSSTTSGPPSPRMISSSLFSSLPKADAARGAPPPPPPASPQAPIADASANKDNTDIVYDYYKQIESRVLPVVSSWFSPLSEEAAAPTQKKTTTTTTSTPSSSPKSARVSAATMLNLESRQRGRRMQQVVRGEEPKATFKIYCKNGSNSNSNSNNNNHTDCYRIYCAAREATLRHAIAERLGMPDTLGIGTTSAIVIEYVDEDGDTCVLSSNEDVADAMRASQAAQETVVKLTVTVPSLTEQLMGAWKQQTWW